MSPTGVRVVVVYPDLLGTYGDGGNGVVLARRAAWRGLDVELVEALSDQPLPVGDLYCLGGGEDGPQVLASERLRADGTLSLAVEGGAAVLAVCAGYQIVGRSFPAADGREVPGVGLLDVTTVRRRGARAVGELLVEVAAPARGPTGSGSGEGLGLGLDLLTGFENHAGATVLGPQAAPLGAVRRGSGNGDGTEGAYQGRVVGTYAHGPVLARNPALADLLLGWVTDEPLEPLDDRREEALRRHRVEAAQGRRWSRRGRARVQSGRRRRPG